MYTLSLIQFCLPLLLLTGFFSGGLTQANDGGKIVIGWSAYPPSLLYYQGYDDYSQSVTELVLEPLIELDLETLKPLGRLATRWTISKDKKQISFDLNQAAKFADGKPLTAADVLYTFNLVMDPKSKMLPFQSKFAIFEKCEILNAHSVRFKAREARFKNLEKFSELYILPAPKNPNEPEAANFQHHFLGSGPYRIDKTDGSTLVRLKKNADYWGSQLPQNRDRYHFDEVQFKAVTDPVVLHEHFKRGDIDYLYFLSSKLWHMETSTGPYATGTVKKLEVKNQLPYSTVGIAWNLRRPLFQDRKLRLALALLLDRERILKELMYNAYIPATGIAHSQALSHSPKNQFIRYDPAKAIALLEEAGWKMGVDKLRHRGGRPFRFEMLTSNPGTTRFLTWYQESLKKAGIEMKIRVVDWATGLQAARTHEFDAIDVAREREIIPGEFSGLWGSETANTSGSSNITGYQNKRADRLMKQIDTTWNEKQRLVLLRQLDELIAFDQPMAFLWEPTAIRLAYSNKLSFANKGFSAYSTWHNIFHTWSLKAAPLSHSDSDLRLALQ